MCQRRPTLECGIIVGWVVVAGAALAVPDPSLFIDRTSSIQRYAMAIGWAASCVLLCRHYTGNKNTPRPSLKLTYRAGQLNCEHLGHRRRSVGLHFGYVAALATVAFVALYASHTAPLVTMPSVPEAAGEPPAIKAELKTTAPPAGDNEPRREKDRNTPGSPRRDGASTPGSTAPATEATYGSETTTPQAPPPGTDTATPTQEAPPREQCPNEPGKPIRKLVQQVFCP